jgi:phytoene desaturase
MPHIVIIGSGFGGLALGIRLLVDGFKVTIVEKNEKPGGHAYPFEKSGYKFDMGPSLITAPEIIQNLIQQTGHDLFKDLNMIKLDPYYRIYFHDGSYFDYSGRQEEMKIQLAAFQPSDAKNYNRFMDASKKIYDVVIQDRMGAKPFMDIKSMIRFAPQALMLKALFSTYNFAKLFFRDSRTRFVFSFHPLFIGGNPFKTPAIYEMIPFLEKNGGVWYTEGGMYSLISLFSRIFNELGGVTFTRSEVTEIVIENKIAVGVNTNNHFIPAEAVVSNADLIHTYRHLIKSEFRKKWTDKRLHHLKYSMSAFILYLGLNRQYQQLLHHTLILSKRYKHLIHDIFNRHILPDDFSMYLHVPTRTDPTMAPENCESMYILIPVTNLSGNIDWNTCAEPYAEKVICFLEKEFGLSNLRKHIEIMKIFTPNDFKEKQNATLGSAWGVEPRLSQTAYFRPHNKSEDIKNLYLVGASTHPGAGIPGCLLTAETTESIINNDFNR